MIFNYVDADDRKPASDMWPTYSRGNPKIFFLNDNADVAIGHGPRATQCAFWNELLPAIRERKCMHFKAQWRCIITFTFLICFNQVSRKSVSVSLLRPKN